MNSLWISLDPLSSTSVLKKEIEGSERKFLIVTLQKGTDILSERTVFTMNLKDTILNSENRESLMPYLSHSILKKDPVKVVVRVKNDIGGKPSIYTTVET